MQTKRPFYYTFPAGADATPPATTVLIDEVGGKAKSLIETSSSSFPVPPGFVLTVQFFESWNETIYQTNEWKQFVENYEANDNATASKELCDAVVDACRRRLVLSDEQRQQLDEAFQRVFGSSNNNNTVVSVRSSSPEEDLSSTSFAGGYHTTLGVRCSLSNDSNLKDAIVASYASMYDYRIVQYKRQGNISPLDPQIAVIVQEQIDSRISGVAFSINPSNNCYDETMVSANFGLGESVVGGTVTPDVYVVDRFSRIPKITSKQISNKVESTWIEEDKEGGDGGGGDSSATTSTTTTRKNENPNKPALSDEQILEVADLVARVEDFFQKSSREETDCNSDEHHPVDIEWAYDENNELYLLQARPVTAYVPLFPELVTKRGEGKNLYMDLIVMSQGFSEPMSVLGLEVWGNMLRAVKPQFRSDGPEGTIWHVHGREYIHLSNYMKSTTGKAMINKVFRHYDKAIDRAISSINLDDYVPEKTPSGVNGILWMQLKQLGIMLPRMVGALMKGEDAMADYLTCTEEFIELCHDDEHMKDEPFDAVAQSILEKFMETIPLLGGIIAPLISRWRLSRLFSGCEGADDLLVSLCMDLNGNPTSEMGHAMVRLASFPEVQGTENGQEFVRQLQEEHGTFSPEFRSAYDDFMKRFGCRGMKEIDIASPRTYEDPEHFFTRLKNICVEKNAILSVSERREQAYEKLHEMAKDMGKESTFEHHANLIHRLLGYREHPKYMLVMMTDTLRRRAIKIAEQFVEEQRLEQVDQIFSLKAEQISEAQANKNLELLPLVEANQRPYKKVQHVKNWPYFIDSRGKIIRGVRKQEDVEKGTLVGDAISPGVVKGRAKVLNGPYEKPLESGEILVARFTEPSWTPIFINAAGVVMEIGGPLQHGSIIAREYGIPCCSGVDDATSLIKDHDLIEVDGSLGTVKILKPDDAETT